MNKAVNDYIPLAMTELKSRTQLKDVYKGYISSLGAGIIMSGLIPTLAFYSAKGENKKGDRSPVADMIFEMIKTRQNSLTNKTLPDISVPNLFELGLALSSDAEKKKLEKEIINASIALKLCLRTFALT